MEGKLVFWMTLVGLGVAVWYLHLVVVALTPMFRTLYRALTLTGIV